jgi:hypothetical protein
MNHEQRIARLERSNRIWKSALAGVIVLGALAGMNKSSSMGESFTGLASHNGKLVILKSDATLYECSSRYGLVSYSED